MRIIAAAFLSASIFAAGCVLGPSSHKGVIGYRPGVVFLKHNQTYRVGILPDGWERTHPPVRTISFYNPSLRSSIATDAYCGKSVGERRLETLGGEIISAFDDRHMQSETKFDLDGRGALRQRVSGKEDGVPVVVDLVIVKKDGCVFDMYAVMPPDADPAATADFEAFYGEFHYEAAR
ncbi:MAG: hypothetical protein V2A66_03850 [Pseudomonadota bacterium]